MGTPEHRFASGSGADSGSCLLIIHITILLIILAIVSIPGNSNRILNCICSCINVIIRIIIRLQLHALFGFGNVTLAAAGRLKVMKSKAFK